MENIKKISLITTLYNEAENILNFLESYREQTKYADEFIIVDGGSSDDTAEIIKKYADENIKLKIKVIIDKTCSKKYISAPIAKGRNIAIENSKYDYIAVTDAGCVLDKNWLKEIVEPFEDENVSIVSGWYEANVINDFQKVYKEIYLPTIETLNLDTFLPSSRSIAFTKECWQKVGGYPLSSMTAEDTKFDLLLKELDCVFKFNPRAIVYWNCPLNYREAIQKSEYYAKGDGTHRLFFGSFLLRLPLLVFPLNILLSKQKRQNFKLTYSVMLHYQIGYIKGLF